MKKVGMNISESILFGVEPFSDCLAATGFESVFTCGNDEELICAVSKKCQQNGIQYEALHAPWTNINALWSDTEDTRKVMDTFRKSADLAENYGIPILVVHISSKEDCPHVTDIGLRNFDEFVNYAAKKNLLVAVENQRKLGNIATILEVYGKETNVQFCWDVGHEKCFAYGREYMPLFGDRCVMTHIHDNFGRYNGDDHLLPYDGTIDFRRTAELIHNANYQGTLMLEVDQPREGSEKYANLSMEQFVSKAYAAVNRIRVISEY